MNIEKVENKKPLLNGYCEKCIYRKVYVSEDENDFENWFCSTTKLITTCVPCTMVVSCEDFKERK